MASITQKDLEKEWSAGKTRPVYYLHGEETTQKEHLIKKIKPLFKPESFNYSSRLAQTCDLAALLDEAHTVPMLASVRFMVLKDAEEFKKKDRDMIAAYLEAPCETTCLVITANFGKDEDPYKKRLASNCADIAFPKMDGDEAATYLNNILFPEVKSDREALELIIDTAGTSIAALDNEAEKIKTYMHDSGKSAFSQKDAAEICGFSQQVIPFALGNQIADKNRPAALKTAELMLSQGEDPLKILSEISFTVEKLLSAKMAGANDIPPGFYTSWQAKIYKTKAGRHNAAQLAKALNRCIFVESELKSSNKLNPSALIRQLIAEITAEPRRQ